MRALLEGLRPSAETEIEIDEVEIVEEELDEIEIIDLFEPLLEEDWGTAVGPMDTAQVAAGLDVPYTSVMEQVSWGLEGVDPTRKVELPLKDVLYVSAALKEMIRFLHDPANYPSVASLTTFLGSADDGALAVLMRAWYESLRAKLPARPRARPLRSPAPAVLPEAVGRVGR